MSSLFLKDYYKSRSFQPAFYFAVLKLGLRTHIKRKIKSLTLSPGRIFDSIAIETMSLCNRKCPNCPVGYFPREKTVLPEKLFHKMIDDLSEMNYSGTISLNNFNEPLLDKRIFDFVKNARKKCPKAFIEFSSNGDFLELDSLKKLAKCGIDLVFATRYSGKIEKKYMELYDSLDFSEKTRILIRAKKTFHTNRAGGIPSMRIKKPLEKTCYLPFYQLVISSEGKAIICCSDYFGEEVVGNVKKQSLKEIWHSEKFEKIRGFLK